LPAARANERGRIGLDDPEIECAQGVASRFAREAHCRALILRESGLQQEKTS
jgi:hypothetical protein